MTLIRRNMLLDQDKPDDYLDRPRQTGDFHGQAPLLWFATALVT